MGVLKSAILKEVPKILKICTFFNGGKIKNKLVKLLIFFAGQKTA